MTKPITYKDSGVDIEAGEEATRRIRDLVGRTSTSQVLSQVGSFGGLFHLAGSPEEDPVLVSSIDGVGTKMKIAVALKRFDTVGHDIVNHCINDILVQGARPLFFLDYIGAHKVLPSQVAEIVSGLSDACLAQGCCLIGGETAEMPDVYGPGDIDLVGTIVGVVERSRILDGSRVCEGDLLIGLASSGLHTNGYTLARKALIGDDPASLETIPPYCSRPLGELLLEPHRCYLKALQPLLEQEAIHAMAHITGGGIPGNLKRVIPDHLQAVVEAGSWNSQPIFRLLEEKTQASQEELYRAFNMGIGMVLCCAPSDAEGMLAWMHSAGCDAWAIGKVIASHPEEPRVHLAF